jgi:hypothetical protein
MQVTYDELTYNGLPMNAFVPERTAAYVSQVDQHFGELTVRETLDFSARCQASRTRKGECGMRLPGWVAPRPACLHLTATVQLRQPFKHAPLLLLNLLFDSIFEAVAHGQPYATYATEPASPPP